MKPSDGEDGFAMIEALAALAIVAIAGAGLIAALGAASGRSAEARSRDLALREARLLISEALVTSEDAVLPTGGQTAGLTWTRKMSAPSDQYPGLEWVEVNVKWATIRKAGATHLEAYRIATK